MEAHILQTLDREGVIQDTGEFASSSGYDHSAVVSSMNSLQAHDMVSSEVLLEALSCVLSRYHAAFSVSAIIVQYWYNGPCYRSGAIAGGCSQPRPAST